MIPSLQQVGQGKIWKGFVLSRRTPEIMTHVRACFVLFCGTTVSCDRKPLQPKRRNALTFALPLKHLSFFASSEDFPGSDSMSFGMT